AKNSETEISFCLAAIDSAVSRMPDFFVLRLCLERIADDMNRSSVSEETDDERTERAGGGLEGFPRAFFATLAPIAVHEPAAHYRHRCAKFCTLQRSVLGDCMVIKLALSSDTHSESTASSSTGKQRGYSAGE